MCVNGTTKQKNAVAPAWSPRLNWSRRGSITRTMSESRLSPKPSRSSSMYTPRMSLA